MGCPWRAFGNRQNGAAQVINDVRYTEDVTPLLCELHWLPVWFQMQLEVLVVTFKTLYGLGMGYLRDFFPRVSTCPTQSSRLGHSAKNVGWWGLEDRPFLQSSLLCGISLPQKVAPTLLTFHKAWKTWLYTWARGSECGTYPVWLYC